ESLSISSNGEFLKQFLMLAQLLVAAQTLGANNGQQVVNCRFETVIDYNIVEFGDMADLLTCRSDTPRNHRLGVLRTGMPPTLQFFDRRREDEHADGARVQATYLGCPLPVDLQYQVAPLRENGLHLRLRSPVTRTMHLGAFEEIAIFQHPEK